MTRLFPDTPHAKQRVSNNGRHHNRPHMQTGDEWRRGPSMPAYSRPKQRKREMDFYPDDVDDMDMETPYGM